MSDAERLQMLVGALTSRPAAEVMLDSWPVQYGLDSLSILVFREQCESMFGVIIPDNDWAEMQRLHDILNFLRSCRSNGNVVSLEAISASPAMSPPFQWGPNYLSESFEIGMPLTGINQLSENALLKFLGDLRWRHMMRASGVSSRNLVDSSGKRLYPTFFFVESSFPEDRPMAFFGENDVIEVVDSVTRYGFSMLDGIAYLIPQEKRGRIPRPLDGLADAVSLGIPAVRMSNIFVMKFDGAEWLKKGRPKEGLIDSIRELPAAPDSYAIVKRAENDGYVELPGDSYFPLHETPVEYQYAVQPDRDVNGAGLLYFANYPLFLDLGERDALQRCRWPWPDELINKRTIVRRQIAYLNNASWKDALRIETQVWIRRHSGNTDLSVAPVYIFANQRMFRVSDGRLMCVSSSRKLLYGIGEDQLDWSGLVGHAT